MKMIKAMKKLKFWSKKKRKKKSNYIYEPYNYYPIPPPPPRPPPLLPPSTCHHYYCSCSSPSSTQPSAPPLPPWLEYEQTQFQQNVPDDGDHHDLSYSSQPPQFPSSQEVVVETSSINPASVPAASSSSSYQQYMAPNPVYGLPIVQSTRRERSSGFFGCVVSFGANLIRCFCPCFRIREVHQEI